MNREIVLGLLFSWVQVFSGWSFGAPHENDYGSKMSEIKVTNAWTPALPPTAEVSAGYFTIINKGTEKLTIVNVASPAYGDVEIHETIVDREITRMSRLSEIDINPKEKILFAPGGKHLMLSDPHFPYKNLSGFIVTLTFSNGVKHHFSMDIKQRKNEPARPVNPHAEHFINN
ncbi:MAG: hypothetical protein CMK36_00915 [Porticoccaceae bacterium]|nr:hypothetical protein [Porticoccaceae bacterium]